VVRLAPAGWKKERLQVSQDVLPYDAEAADSVSDKESRSTWARLIAQVYEVDPLVCPRCSAAMRILAVNQRTAGGPEDPAPPGEDRPLTTGVRAGFASTDNLSPCGLRGVTLRAATFLSPPKSGDPRLAAVGPIAGRHCCHRIRPKRTRKSRKVVSIAPWWQIPATHLPSSDYEKSYHCLAADGSLASGGMAARATPRVGGYFISRPGSQVASWGNNEWHCMFRHGTMVLSYSVSEVSDGLGRA
jgi:hypothetical protein